MSRKKIETLQDGMEEVVRIIRASQSKLREAVALLFCFRDFLNENAESSSQKPLRRPSKKAVSAVRKEA